MRGRWPRLAAALAGALLLTACDPAASEGEAQPVAAARAEKALPLGEGFDFYVLALSWSPSYCEAEGEEANRQQCGAKKPHAFVVHGLWPQWERGYPEECVSAEETVAGDRLRSLYDLMPSAGLIRHQWRKHGTCTGLSQVDYFDTVRAARDRVRVPAGYDAGNDALTIGPDALERSFIDANPGLLDEGVAVTCKDGYLREVRLCLTKALEFRACAEVDARACRSRQVSMPAAGG